MRPDAAYCVPTSLRLLLVCPRWDICGEIELGDGKRLVLEMENWFLKTIPNRARWLSLAAIILLAGSGWIWISAVPDSETTGGRIPSPREGFLAPDFTLELIGGGEVTLSDERGKVVIVNLWASWCPPCKAEMPAIEEVYLANQDRGLEVLAVNTTFQDQEAAAVDFIGEFGLTFPILMDRTGEVSRQYLLRAMPSTFFIDREGIIRKVIIGGPMSEATLQTAVEELLGAGP
jgi:cytochrome c biogenesis protein CcmG/thiol:disulfide interchange protein DsbE